MSLLNGISFNYTDIRVGNQYTIRGQCIMSDTHVGSTQGAHLGSLRGETLPLGFPPAPLLGKLNGGRVGTE